MSEYPKQFISEMATALPNLITDFLKGNLIINNDPEMDINKLMTSVLDDHYTEGLGSDPFQKAYARLINNRWKKKQRWFKSFMNDINFMSMDDNKFPLSKFVQQKAVLDEDQWKILYGSLTLKDIVQRECDKVIKWKENPDTYFIEFPAFDNVSQKQRWNVFKEDVAYCFGNLFRLRYNGSIDNFFRVLPTELIDQPIFSPKSFKIQLNEIANDIYENFYISDDGEMQLRTTIEKKKLTEITPTSFDPIDLDIFDRVYKNIEEDFYETRMSIVDKYELARLLHPHPSKKHYEAINERCLNYAALNYTLYNKEDKNGVSFNFFDIVDTRGMINGKQVVIFHFASAHYNAIQKKVMQVTSNNYARLNNHVSQILYFTLEMERVALSTQYYKNGESIEDALLSKTYNFNFFLKRIRLPERNKKKNIKTITESLNEFYELGIAIKNISFGKDDIHISYLPLTQDEYDDLTFRKKRPS